MRKIKIFLSYSRKDYERLLPLFVQFPSILKTITYKGEKHKVEFWFDQHTSPGSHWDNTIKWELKNADIVLFFVTPAFLESGYIQSLEIPLALERQEESKIHLLPILVEACSFEKSKLGHLQFMPNYKGYLKPLNEWKNINAFWDYAKFALKVGILNSLDGIPDPFYFNKNLLTSVEQKKHILYFSPPEIAQLMKKKTRKKRKPKAETGIMATIKKTISKFFKF